MSVTEAKSGGNVARSNGLVTRGCRENSHVENPDPLAALTGRAPGHLRHSPVARLAAPTIPARDTVSIVWTAPDTEGQFTIASSDCKIEERSLTIEVTKP